MTYSGLEIVMTGAQHKIVGIGFGIAGAYIGMTAFNEPYSAFILPASAVGCMLPDIDHDKTKIGRKRKFITNLTGKAFNILVILAVFVVGILGIAMMWGFDTYGFSSTNLLIGAGGLIIFAILRKFLMNSKTYQWASKHRGLMHTLLVPVCLIFLLQVSDFPVYWYTVVGITIGYCSHLFADMLTIEGCPVLWPLSKKNIRFMKLKTKDKSCTYAAYAVALIACAVGYVLGGIL